MPTPPQSLRRSAKNVAIWRLVKRRRRKPPMRRAARPAGRRRTSSEFRAVVPYQQRLTSPNADARSLRIEACLIEHAKRVARLHKLAYRRDHFSSCLPAAQLEAFYAAQISANHNCLVAIKHGELVGFVIAGYGTKAATADFVRRHRWKLLQSLLRNPRFLANKFNTVLGRLAGRNGYESPTRLRLLSIAVHPDHQGQGVSKALLRYLERQLLAQGITEYGLSVKTTNAGAMAVYQRCGFVEEAVHGGTIYYRKALSRKRLRQQQLTQQRAVAAPTGPAFDAYADARAATR